MSENITTKKQISQEKNDKINIYVQEQLLNNRILKVLKLQSNDNDLLIKRLPYAQSYDFIDKNFNEKEENKKDIIVYYSFASSNNQKHISQILQSEILNKEYLQYNKLFNYDDYVRVDELLKVDVKQNVPILFTIFINKKSPQLKEYQLKLVNNLAFNQN